MNVKFTKTDRGDFATMPRAEFESLIERMEDMEDIIAADEVKRRLASGEEEMLPSGFIDRMLAGESILKLWREHRGMNQSELGRASGVNRVVVADIEAGRSRGSADALKKLADALGLTVDDLL